MNKTTYLGEFEHMVLLAVLRRKDEAYGISIRDELDATAMRSAPFWTAMAFALSATH